MPLDERMRLLEELKARGSTHACPECQKPAYCAMEDGKSVYACWCMGVRSPVNPLYSDDACMCKECLENK